MDSNSLSSPSASPSSTHYSTVSGADRSSISATQQKPHLAQDGLVAGEKTDSKHEARPNFYTRHFRESWTAEIIAWLLSAGCVALIVVSLAIYHAKSLEEWRWRITVNTMVNFVSQLAQTSLLIPVASSISQLKWLWFRQARVLKEIESFDEASRQPLDSIVFLWRYPKWSVFEFLCDVRLMAVGYWHTLQRSVHF